MRDDTLVEPFCVPEIYVDSFEHMVANGMMMASGYRIMPRWGKDAGADKVVVVKIVMKAANVPEAMADATEALRTPCTVLEEKERAHHH